MTAKVEDLGKVISTDVLILGSGAAGCSAAMAAKQKGASVLLVDKAKLEGSGSICGGNDHFMANLNSGPEWDTDQTLANYWSKTLNGISTRVINDKWIKMLPITINLLEEAGIEFLKNPDGSYARTVGFGQPGAWWIMIKDGQFIKRRLAKMIRGLGIEVLDHVMITRLFKQDDKIAGAAGFNIVDGNFYIIRAKTIVIALGQNASRATTNSTCNPFNSQQYPYNTGSQCILAYEIGAKIVNLDFQGGTIIPKGFGAPGMNGLNSMGGHELNAFGERFMVKYHPNMENCPRAVQVSATYQEQIEGKGPPFYMDMRHLSKEDLDLLQNVLMVGDKATFNDYLDQLGISFASHPMEVEVSEIRFGGTLLTNNKLESTISGLFSGCQFFGISGAMSGGYSAGIEASETAIRQDKLADIDTSQVKNEKERIFQPIKMSNGLSPKEFENLIRQVMNYYMGYVRNEKGIELAIKKLNLIENYENDIEAANFHELMRANEAKHLLKHCQLSAKAVMERKESGRTQYKRSDYPNLNKEFDNKYIVLWQENGIPKIAFESCS